MAALLVLVGVGVVGWVLTPRAPRALRHRDAMEALARAVARAGTWRVP